MAFFSWFGEQEHRVFHYRPRYYDEEKEELKQTFGAVDGSLDKESETYKPGAHLRGAFRNGNYARYKGASRVQSIIGVIGLILVVVILFYIIKFYSLIA